MMELNRPQLSVSADAPLPRRTGRADFPHPALACFVSSREHSQAHQSQMVQVRIQAHALAGAPAPLTASAQMHARPLPHEVIEAAKGLPRVAQAKIVGPAPQIPVHSPNQLRQRCVALVMSDHLPQRVPFPRHRFARGHEVPVASRAAILVAIQPEGVAQKVQACAGLPPNPAPGFCPG
jgi:hypothetical protein